MLINARFLTQTLTGVQRTAKELLLHLEKVAPESFSPQLITPKHPLLHSYTGKWAVRSAGPFNGHLWEQFTLGVMARQQGLLSLANVGPLIAKNQIVMIYDLSTFDSPQSFDPRFAQWYRWLLPRLINAACHVITISNFSKQRMIDYGFAPEDKISVIYPGIAPSFSPVSIDAIQTMRERLALPAQYILTVGSLDPRKNLHRLLQAWRKTSARFPNVKLVVAGGTWKSLAAITQPVDSENVLFLGYVDEIDLPALYSGAMAFAYPSLYEGFGLPPLEAMACGVPVLTSNTTAIAEISGNAALTVHPESIDQIASGLEHLLTSEQTRTQLIQAGYVRARQYNWLQSAQILWNVIANNLL